MIAHVSRGQNDDSSSDVILPVYILALIIAKNVPNIILDPHPAPNLIFSLLALTLEMV